MANDSSAGNSGSAESQANQNQNVENQSQSSQYPAFTVPEEYKSEKVFENVKDYPTLFKNYVHAEKSLGKAIFLPDEKDPDNVKAEKMGKVYNKLGRPEKETDYKMEDLPILPRGWEWSDDKIKTFQKTAHKMGLSNAAFGELLTSYAQDMAINFPDPVIAQKKTEETLKKEWGENTYKIRLGEAQEAVRLYGGEDAIKFFNESGMGSNQAIVKMMANIGRELVEHGAIDPGSVGNGTTRKEADAEANKIISDSKDPYNLPRHPDHRARVEYVTELLNYPETNQAD